MASSVHGLHPSDITTDGLYKKDRKESNLSTVSARSSRSSSSSRSPRSPWVFEERFLPAVKGEVKPLPKGVEFIQAGTLDEIVSERVDGAVNEWIAEKHPPVNLNPLVKVDALKGSRKPKALWVGLQWELKPAVLPLNLRMHIVAFCLDETGRCGHPLDVVHLGNPNGRDDCVQHSTGGRKGDMETIRLNLYPLQVLGIRALAVVCHLQSAQHIPQRLQTALGCIRCSIYDKFGNRHRTSAQLAVAGPILANSTTIELLRLQQEGSTWMVGAPLKQFAGPLKTFFQEIRPTPPPPALKKGETLSLESLPAAEKLLLDFAFTSEAGGGIDVVIAGLDAKGQLAMPLATSSGPAIPGVGPGAADPAKSRQTMEIVGAQLPATVVSLVCIGCLPPLSVVRGYSFLQVLHGSVRLYTRQGEAETTLATHELAQELARETCVEFCRLQRTGAGKWKAVAATSEGMALGREDLLRALTAGQWLVKPSPVAVKLGDRVNLSKTFPGLRTLSAALTCVAADGQQPRVTLLTLCLGGDGRLASSTDCVGGRTRQTRDGAVAVQWVTAEGRPEEAVTVIQLATLRDSVEHLLLTAVVDTASNSGSPRSFSQAKAITLRLSDATADLEIVRYVAPSPATPGAVRGLDLGVLSRRADNAWLFTPKADPGPETPWDVVARCHHTFLRTGGQQALSERCGTVALGLGWEPAGAGPLPLDVVVFALDAGGRVTVDDHLVCAHARASKDNVLKRDVRSGEGREDDEVVEVQLKALPAAVVEVAVYALLLGIGDAAPTLAALRGGYLRISDPGPQRPEFLRASLDGDHRDATCLHVGSLLRVEGRAWAYAHNAEALKANLADLCARHGAPVPKPSALGRHRPQVPAAPSSLPALA